MSYDDRHAPGRPDLTGERDRAALEETWHVLAPDPALDPVPHAEVDTDAAWAALASELFADEALVTPSPAAATHADRSARTGRGSTPLRWFAAGIVAAAATVAAISFAPITESAGPGIVRTVALFDGSTAELAPGTELVWRRGLGWIPGVDAGDREVRLDGEAFFDVRRDGTRFTVRTRDAQVRVLGTRFNVRAHASAPTRVTVEEGRVAVSDLEGRGRVELGAGQGGGILADGRAAMDPQLDLRDLVWRSGGLTIRDQSFGDVVDALETRFGTRIVLGAGVEADEDRLTLHYSQRVDLETVLADLAAARGLDYRPTSDGWELYRE